MVSSESSKSNGLGHAKTLKLSGAESLAAAGNIFIGQTEAPLLVNRTSLK